MTRQKNPRRLDVRKIGLLVRQSLAKVRSQAQLEIGNTKRVVKSRQSLIKISLQTLNQSNTTVIGTSIRRIRINIINLTISTNRKLSQILLTCQIVAAVLVQKTSYITNAIIITTLLTRRVILISIVGTIDIDISIVLLDIQYVNIAQNKRLYSKDFVQKTLSTLVKYLLPYILSASSILYRLIAKRLSQLFYPQEQQTQLRYSLTRFLIIYSNL